jgi:hypothetical protein
MGGRQRGAHFNVNPDQFPIIIEQTAGEGNVTVINDTVNVQKKKRMMIYTIGTARNETSVNRVYFRRRSSST